MENLQQTRLCGPCSGLPQLFLKFTFQPCSLYYQWFLESSSLFSLLFITHVIIFIVMNNNGNGHPHAISRKYGWETKYLEWPYGHVLHVHETSTLDVITAAEKMQRRN